MWVYAILFSVTRYFVLSLKSACRQNTSWQISQPMQNQYSVKRFKKNLLLQKEVITLIVNLILACAVAWYQEMLLVFQEKQAWDLVNKSFSIFFNAVVLPLCQIPHGQLFSMPDFSVFFGTVYFFPSSTTW